MVVTVESIRKWLAGETRPREDKAEKLGKVLDIDPVWLRIGRHVTAGQEGDSQSIMTPIAPPLQVGIRHGHFIEIRNLPLNLTKPEAVKLANIVLAHAADG
jgi:hypothetical protein